MINCNKNFFFRAHSEAMKTRIVCTIITMLYDPALPHFSSYPPLYFHVYERDSSRRRMGGRESSEVALLARNFLLGVLFLEERTGRFGSRARAKTSKEKEKGKKTEREARKRGRKRKEWEVLGSCSETFNPTDSYDATRGWKHYIR